MYVSITRIVHTHPRVRDVHLSLDLPGDNSNQTSSYLMNKFARHFKQYLSRTDCYFQVAATRIDCLRASFVALVFFPVHDILQSNARCTSLCTVCVCVTIALVGVAYAHPLRAPALDYCVLSTYRDNCKRRFVNESNLHVLCTCIVSACMCLLHRVRYKHRLFRLVLVHLYWVPTAYFHVSNSHGLLCLHKSVQQKPRKHARAQPITSPVSYLRHDAAEREGFLFQTRHERPTLLIYSLKREEHSPSPAYGTLLRPAHDTLMYLSHDDVVIIQI